MTITLKLLGHREDALDGGCFVLPSIVGYSISVLQTLTVPDNFMDNLVKQKC